MMTANVSKTMHRFLLLVLAVLLPVITSACSRNARGESEKSLLVEALEYQLLPGGARILTGQLHNLTDQPVRIAQVQVSLFDGKNRRVESMYFEVRDIEARGRADFREAIRSKRDIQGAKVHSVLLPSR